MTAHKRPDGSIFVAAIIDGRICHVGYDLELPALLEAVFDSPHRGWAARLFVFDEPHLDRVADHRLRVAADLDTAWAALNFMHYDHTHLGWHAWNTFYSTTEPTPRLPFGSGTLRFPTDAALPLPHARQAVVEYCHTATQPTCVQWQPSNYF